MAGPVAPVFERIYIHSYKCLVESDLRLQNTVLLLGGNGVGKTSVPDAMFALRELLAGEVKRSKDAIANLTERDSQPLWLPPDQKLDRPPVQ